MCTEGIITLIKTQEQHNLLLCRCIFSVPIFSSFEILFLDLQSIPRGILCSPAHEMDFAEYKNIEVNADVSQTRAKWGCLRVHSRGAKGPTAETCCFFPSEEELMRLQFRLLSLR